MPPANQLFHSMPHLYAHTIICFQTHHFPNACCLSNKHSFFLGIICLFVWHCFLVAIRCQRHSNMWCSKLLERSKNNSNFCIALFSDGHKLTALYNTLQHFLSENKITKGNESNTYIRSNNAYTYTKNINYMCRMSSGSI